MNSQSPPLRRKFLQVIGGVGVGSSLFHRALAAQVAESGRITAEMISQAEWVAGIELDEDERESVARAVGRNLIAAERLRQHPVDADTVPALVFRPDFFYGQVDETSQMDGASVQVGWSIDDSVRRGADEDLAFSSISHQASLLARGKISSRELTQLYLGRLQRYDPLLKCVITMLEEHALKEADASDQRRRAGQSRGVLDGIPWVAKDLIAVPPYKTTWGAAPFQDQVRNQVATVASKLANAGAVLLAKVTLGTMAWGDQWFGGRTRNPWNAEQGSSGSSAGSASAVAAGLATFALGSETLGSIVSPTRRCRTSGLRPTFGRVSRAGCMPLSWSMDKIGPIARHVEDLALVFPELLGPDGRDPTLVNRPFHWPSTTEPRSLKIGVPPSGLSSTESAAVDLLRREGAKIVDFELRSELPVSSMNFILGTEAATVFDDAFRSDPRADYGNWPATFRQSQFVPAIQYLRANRLRGQLVTETEKQLQEVDVVLGGNDLLLTNLTGHPSLVVACGSAPDRNGNPMPGTIKLTSAAHQESTLLDVGAIVQAALPPVPARPSLELAADEESSTSRDKLQNANGT